MFIEVTHNEVEGLRPELRRHAMILFANFVYD